MGGEVAARDASAAASPGARRGTALAATEDDDDAPGGGSGGKAGPLPELDDLVARLPADVRDTLDELFRARFVSVKKLPKRLFQAAAAKQPPQARAAE